MAESTTFIPPKIDFTRLNYTKGRVVVFNFDEFVAVFEGGNSTSKGDISASLSNMYSATYFMIV